MAPYPSSSVLSFSVVLFCPWVLPCSTKGAAGSGAVLAPGLVSRQMTSRPGWARWQEGSAYTLGVGCPTAVATCPSVWLWPCTKRFTILGCPGIQNLTPGKCGSRGASPVCSLSGPSEAIYHCSGWCLKGSSLWGCVSFLCPNYAEGKDGALPCFPLLCLPCDLETLGRHCRVLQERQCPIQTLRGWIGMYHRSAVGRCWPLSMQCHRLQGPEWQPGKEGAEGLPKPQKDSSKEGFSRVGVGE